MWTSLKERNFGGLQFWGAFTLLWALPLVTPSDEDAIKIPSWLWQGQGKITVVPQPRLLSIKDYAPGKKPTPEPYPTEGKGNAPPSAPNSNLT